MKEEEVDDARVEDGVDEQVHKEFEGDGVKMEYVEEFDPKRGGVWRIEVLSEQKVHEEPKGVGSIVKMVWSIPRDLPRLQKLEGGFVVEISCADCS